MLSCGVYNVYEKIINMKSILLLVCGVLVLNFAPMSRLMAIQPEVMADTVKTVKLTGKVVDVETGDAIPLSTLMVKELGWCLRYGRKI